MDDAPTCGKGLAEHSALPAKISQLIDALAETLETHQKALILSDANARAEHDAYTSLAKSFRQIASQLQLTARQMAGYKHLPMGKHDETVMGQPLAFEVFEEYVKLEDDLLAFLRTAVDRDKQMLSEWREQT